MKSVRIPIILVATVCAVLGTGFTLLGRARANTNTVALAASPKGVTVARARAATFRATRRYVGTLSPWLEAKVGPQLVAAYVSNVMVRPGASVKAGAVVATLDCRNSTASNLAVLAQARAIEARQRASASETARFQSLLDGGFVSPNEVEQRQAQTAAEAAQLAALQAQSQGKRLEVGDCVLRAPFDGEVARRSVDPGAYVRPGSAIVTIVDRHLLRLVADVPETDFSLVAIGTPIRAKLLANATQLEGKITRRSPAADDATRTVRIEVDIEPSNRDLPVGTTAEINLEVGAETPASEIPLAAAKVQGDNATVFVVSGEQAKKLRVAVLGERGGSLFVATELEPNSLVVTEGRAQLMNGDRVVFKEETSETTQPQNARASEAR